jgi:hypothetical protein
LSPVLQLYQAEFPELTKFSTFWTKGNSVHGNQTSAGVLV